MILDHFQLREAPFSIAPDPRYLFMSERHREALAHLLYGAKGTTDGMQGAGGFVLLTGEIGAGKTTVCRCFLEQLPENCDVAYIFNPRLATWEMLDAICQEFHIPVRSRHVLREPDRAEDADSDATGSAAPTVRPSVRDYVDALNARLLQSHAQGRVSVLIIDEAQNLSIDVLEQLRLLTNLETHRSKLLHIILIGQPELRDIVARPELRQLAQRISARYHLEALSEDETARYVRHRLAVAGLREGVTLFPPARLRQIHRLTGGVPRRINLLCDRALLGASVEGHRQVEGNVLARAASELAGDTRHRPHRRGATWAGALGVAAVCGVAALALLPSAQPLRERLLLSARSDQSVAERPAIPPANAAARSPDVAAEKASATNPPATSAEKVDDASAAAAPRSEDSAPSLHTADSLAQLLQRPPWADAHQAMRALAALWQPGIRLDGGAACERLVAADLRCHVGHGGLAELRRLDRPALVNLRSDTGQIVPMLLTGLSATQAELRSATQVARIDVLALAGRMTPDFLTLWRLPRAYRDRLVLHDRGADVDWLAHRLMPDGRRDAHAEFDAALERRVRAFQAAQGLQADGIVGPQTLMQINAAGGAPEPVLHGHLAAMHAAAGKEE